MKKKRQPRSITVDDVVYVWSLRNHFSMPREIVFSAWREDRAKPVRIAFRSTPETLRVAGDLNCGASSYIYTGRSSADGRGDFIVDATYNLARPANAAQFIRWAIGHGWTPGHALTRLDASVSPVDARLIAEPTTVVAAIQRASN